MPRFFFHVHDGNSLPDQDGLELANEGQARDIAVVAAGEALRDTGGRFWSHPEWSMVVVDVTGQAVCRLRFSAE